MYEISALGYNCDGKDAAYRDAEVEEAPVLLGKGRARMPERMLPLHWLKSRQSSVRCSCLMDVGYHIWADAGFGGFCPSFLTLLALVSIVARVVKVEGAL